MFLFNFILQIKLLRQFKEITQDLELLKITELFIVFYEPSSSMNKIYLNCGGLITKQRRGGDSDYEVMKKQCTEMF